MAYLKPQTPLQYEENYFYPLTTVDQVIMDNGERLNTVFKSNVKIPITLLSSGWSTTQPYQQSFTSDEYNFDDLSVDAYIKYTGIRETDLLIQDAAYWVSYIKKSGNKITFYCLEGIPENDIPMEIIGTSLNNISTIQEVQGAELNFEIIGGTAQPTSTIENTIWINTDATITDYMFSATEPTEPVEGMVWISTGVSSVVPFYIIKDQSIVSYPLEARQYISGAWVPKFAKSFQDGKWVEWYYVLFNKTLGMNYLGDSSNWSKYHSDYANAISVNSSGNLQIGMSGHSYNTAVNLTPVDVTLYNYMYFTVVSKNISNNVYVGLGTQTSGFTAWSTAHFTKKIDNPAVGTHKIDISDLTGIYYFGVTIHAKVTNALVLSDISFRVK